MIMRFSFVLFFLLTAFSAKAEPIRVTVAISPVAHWVELIGGDAVEVQAVQSSGDSCELFEPRPRSIKWLGKSDVFFRIGVGAEVALLRTSETQFPELKVISLASDPLYADCPHCEIHSDHFHSSHIWIVPSKVREAGKIIYEQLSASRPDEEELFHRNWLEFDNKLQQLTQKLEKQIGTGEGAFVVLHSAFHEFAEAFGLTEIAIGSNSLGTQARSFRVAINLAEKATADRFVLQAHERKESAELIAKQLSIPVFEIDLLQKDWFKLMEELGEIFAPLKIEQ